jgi:hypothetical protein
MNAFLDWLHDAAEQRALPLVCAFGLGVLVALHGADAEIAAVHDTVRALDVQLEHARIVCGAQPDPDAIAATLAAHVAEVRP